MKIDKMTLQALEIMARSERDEFEKKKALRTLRRSSYCTTPGALFDADGNVIAVTMNDYVLRLKKELTRTDRLMIRKWSRTQGGAPIIWGAGETRKAEADSEEKLKKTCKDYNISHDRIYVRHERGGFTYFTT
jgi:hypothetical protein